MTVQHHEYLVAGAGPSGLQVGYFFAVHGMDYAILEKGDTAGEFFKHFPRHRTLISANKIYTGYDNPDLNMRWDWNSLITHDSKIMMKDYSKKYFPPADKFVEYLQDFAGNYALNIYYNQDIRHISKDEEGLFHVVTNGGAHYTCRYLIMATGVSKPYIPPVNGIELCENYYDCSVNPEDFINKRVLLIGKGNSAFETAENLIETAAVIHLVSPTPINFAWRTHYVGHLRAVNNNLLDTYQLKLQNGLINGHIEKIEKTEKGTFLMTVNYTNVKGGETEQLEYDRVIACCGFRFDDTFFDEEIKPMKIINERYPKQTPEWESVNVPNLYFAGNLTHSRDFKKSTSGFIHGFRYNAQALVNILRYKHMQVPFTATTVEAGRDALTDLLIKKINTTSALWQQFGFLADLLVIEDGNQNASYYEVLPVDYIHNSHFKEENNYFIITLDYGPGHHDPFAHDVMRINKFDKDKAHDSQFLHPVIRKYSKGTMVSELHLIEDFRSEFNRKEHISALSDYLEKELSSTSAPQVATAL